MKFLKTLIISISILVAINSLSYATSNIIDLTGEWEYTGGDNYISYTGNLYINQASEPIGSRYALSGSIYLYGTSKNYPDRNIWGWVDFEDGIDGTQSYFDIDTMRIHIEGYQIRERGSTLSTGTQISLGTHDATVTLDGRLINGNWKAHTWTGWWRAELIQVDWSPDFNGDSKVNIDDLVILIEHWGQDQPSVDVIPRPFRDGIIDIQDLEFVLQYLGQDVNDPSLVAYWPLDETEGMFAIDSAGDNDAIVIGGTEWLPGNGQIDGTLQLDGVSGNAIADLTVNPANGPFSIITWIKAGASDQTIVSQQAISNWLATDAEGNLMTELKSSDPAAGPLVSETVITDEQWHRIGLVWNGSKRMLYVDSVLVAEDVQPGLESSQMGLYIGVDRNYTPGTFFSGLIDDIRIYKRVVHP